jgi:hypothetical protein
MAMRTGRIVRIGFAAAASAALAACTSLPGWLGLSPDGEAATGPIVYPDLTQIPDRPAAPTKPDERQAIIRSLLEDRALTAQAAESLRREIETDFELPEPPAGS